MKSITLPGAKIRASCETCGRFTEATWGYHSYKLDDGTEVDNVMQARCDTCGRLNLMAGQASHRIRRAIDDRERRRTTIRVQRELQDLMGSQLSSAGVNVTDHDAYLRALFVAVHENEDRVLDVLAHVSDPVLEQPATAVINLTVNQNVGVLLERLREATGENTSEVLRRLIVLADDSLSEAVEQHLRREAYVTA